MRTVTAKQAFGVGRVTATERSSSVAQSSPTSTAELAPLPTTGKRQNKPSAPGLLQGFFKPAVAAVMTAAVSVMLLASPAPAQAQGIQEAPTRIERVVTNPHAALDSAKARLMAADANGDGKVVGRSYGNELQSIDPLARALYDYVDFVNPRGQTSLWGADSRGDYMEGGLGLGYSFRPKHGTGNRILTEADLDLGITMLKRSIAQPKTDQPSQDLSSIREAAKSELGLSDSLVNQEIWSATDRLLERIVSITNAKERSTGNTTATATYSEVLEGLTPGSLEKIIAEKTLGHEAAHYADNLRVMSAVRTSLGAKPRNETGKVADAAMQYILLVGKRAQETHLSGKVLANLPR